MDAERARLKEAVAAAMDRAGAAPMQWGVDDCALWCAEPLRAALGYDAAEAFRTGYVDQAGAHKALGRLGLAFAIRSVAKKHGWRRVDPKAARPGDIGLLQTGESISTVICNAPGWFVGRSEKGWSAMSWRYIRLAWSVV